MARSIHGLFGIPMVVVILVSTTLCRVNEARGDQPAKADPPNAAAPTAGPPKTDAVKAEAVNVVPELLGSPFPANLKAANCIKVTATRGKGDQAKPEPGVVVTVTVESGKATVCTEKSDAETKSAKTDEKGTLYLSLKLGSADQPPTLRITATTSDGTGVEVFPNALYPKVLGYAGSLLSDRVNSEVVLGVVLQNKYDATGVSQGFTDKRYLGQLTFDTLWPRAASGSHWHTRFDVRFSSVPLTDADTKTGTALPTSFTQVASSMTATLSGIYQPHYFTLRSPSSHREGLAYDVFRLGLVFSAGFITREKLSSADDNSLVGRYGLGLLFTHNQADAQADKDDVINRFPLRFVEAQAVRFDTYAGRTNTVRWVIEAGLRLPVIGSDTLPFYGGISANVGSGPDDVRIFLAFIFDLAKVVGVTGLHQ